jgi:hypothetical protein
MAKHKSETGKELRVEQAKAVQAIVNVLTEIAQTLAKGGKLVVVDEDGTEHDVWTSLQTGKPSKAK